MPPNDFGSSELYLAKTAAKILQHVTLSEYAPRVDVQVPILGCPTMGVGFKVGKMRHFLKQLLSTKSFFQTSEGEKI